MNYFTEYHRAAADDACIRIAAALVNSQLYAKVSENERRMDREMKIAREIQLRLMPEEIPSVAPLDIAVTFKPVAQLGGDLYDFIEFDDGRLAIVVGDVAGKGAPAALYAALSSGIIRTRATRKYPPGQMLELVNKTVFTTHRKSVLRADLCHLRSAAAQVTLANSGLPYPLLVREGVPRFLEPGEFPLDYFRIRNTRNSNWTCRNATSWCFTQTVWWKPATKATRILDSSGSHKSLVNIATKAPGKL